MNTYSDKVCGLIWHMCQSEENEDRNPPDYWFSFERSKHTKLSGIMSKDMVASYTVRSVNPGPQFSLRNILDETPAYQSEHLTYRRDDCLSVLAWAASSDETEMAGVNPYGGVQRLTPQELERLRSQERAIFKGEQA